MKLVASMPVFNEMDRHLEIVIGQLMHCCDEVRCLDDCSDDGTYKYLKAHPNVSVTRNDGISWREHEGQFRQNLVEWTLGAEPTHIFAIDADELLPEPDDLRTIMEQSPAVEVFSLRMVEVWDFDSNPWLIRQDGGWQTHDVPVIYKLQNKMRIANKKMASGRVPLTVRKALAQRTGLDMLHLGWADKSSRGRRHKRYQELDGGNYHAKKHLDSILWPDEDCELRPYEHEIDVDLQTAVRGLVPA